MIRAREIEGKGEDMRGLSFRRPAILGVAALALAGCAEVEKTFEPRRVAFPEPISAGRDDGGRVSGALKPGGAAAVTPSGGRNALQRAEIYRGEATPERRIGERPGIADTGDGVALNFAGADLVEVVDVIIGQTLRRNYVIDPTVSGTVTLRTTRPIPRDALIPVLENILALNGAALITRDQLYSVVPSAEAAGVGSVVVDPASAGYGQGRSLYVIPMRYASAAALRDVAQAVVGQGRQIAVDQTRNMLLFVGSGQEARSIEEMASVLDVDSMSGRSFGLFPVEVAQADEVASELETIFGQQAGAGAVNFLPIERMNAVLVIASTPSYLDQARAWVSRLDRADADAGSGERVFVYYVRNGRAPELAEILSQVFGGGAEKKRTAARGGVAPTLEPITLTGETETDAAEPNAGAENASTRVATRAAVFAGAEDDGLTGGGGQPAARFIADERNNTIIMVATPTQYDMARATLQRLDIVPLQVLIEATIAEVTLNDDLRFGLQWFFESGNFSSTLATTEAGVVAGIFPGFSGLFSTNGAKVALNALAEVTDVNVISSPQLMVLDNQSARLQVGDQVPVATQSSVIVDNTAVIGDDTVRNTITNEVTLVDTGVILEVTPRVNSSGLVTLEVVQEVSDAIATSTSSIDSPTIQQRRIETVIAVNDGDTVALGGLIRDRAESGESGVPFLKDVPVVGNLFKTTDRATTRTELLVLITPRVLRSSREAREVAEEMRTRLSALNKIVVPF
jgi:general secretion pathway protein D